MFAEHVAAFLNDFLYSRYDSDSESWWLEYSQERFAASNGQSQHSISWTICCQEFSVKKDVAYPVRVGAPCNLDVSGEDSGSASAELVVGHDAYPAQLVKP